MTTGVSISAAAFSIISTIARYSSSSAVGGRNTYRVSPRFSATSAVRGTKAVGSTSVTVRPNESATSSGNGSARTDGSASYRTGAGPHDNEFSGRRRPAGEVPGVSTRRPRRVVHRALCHAVSSSERLSGRTNAVGSVIDASSDASSSRRAFVESSAGSMSASASATSAAAAAHAAARAAGSVGSAPGSPGGSADNSRIRTSGSSNAGITCVAGRPNADANADNNFSAAGSPPEPGFGPDASSAIAPAACARVCHGSARRSRRRQIGWPSARHMMAICQRGSGSPGYHLP